MATYYARKAGNVNATDVWATTPGGVAGNFFPSFTNSDTLMSNGFTVTLNVNTTVLEIRNDTANGATNGGSFTLNSGITLTANCTGGSSTLVNWTGGGSGTSSSIIGNINTSGAGTCIYLNNSSGTLNITGSINSTTGTTIYVNGGTTLNIVGNCNGISSRAIYHVNASTNINITGNINAISGTGIDLFNGYGSTTAIFTITGNILSVNAVGIVASISGLSVIVNGSVIGGNTAIGIVVSNNVSVTATRVKGNNFGNGSVGMTSQVGISASQNSTVKVYEIEYGDLGQSPTSGPISIVDASSNVCLTYRTGGLSKKTLVDAAATTGAFPSINNVRLGTSYNNGNSIGTMAVPSPNSVANGVSVDNTTGNAVLTPANVWNYLTSNISTSNSIGERLKNCSTIASVGEQLANSLS